MKKILVLVFLLFLVIVVFFYSLVVYKSQNESTLEFVVNKPFLIIVKGLANKDSLEKIAKQNDATIEEKYWEEFNIYIPQRVLRLREYKLNGSMKFKIIKKDLYLGNIFLPFIQKMRLEKDRLTINTKLTEPQKSIVFYEKNIEITPIPNEQKTHVSIKSNLTVKKTIFYFFKKTMDKKVYEANKKDIEQLKLNILSLSGPF